MTLDPAAAVAALKARICDPLGLSVTEAAYGIHETVNETMAQAASIHALEKGRKASAYIDLPVKAH